MPRPGRWPRRLRRLLVGGTLAGLVAGVVGHVVRDRNVVLALMMYVPLLPLGVGAAALDLLLRGRALFPRGPRFALSVAGAASVALAAAPLVGHGPPKPPTPSGAPSAGPGGEVRLLHWNVLWGGGRGGEPQRWAALVDEVRRRDPDVVVLSEAPARAMVDRFTRRMGEGWSAVQVTNAPGEHYYYSLVVASRWPVRLEGRVPVANGSAVLASVATPGGPLRVMAADGRSEPWVWRTPFLRDVAGACETAAARGEPVDVVAGDFNALGRSVGFDAFASAVGGFEKASRSTDGWRATYPAPFPLIDIDHVWVSRRHAVLGCELFRHRNSDHRGHLVRLRPSAGAAAGAP